jgi:hypothetical protein
VAPELMSIIKSSLALLAFMSVSCATTSASDEQNTYDVDAVVRNYESLAGKPISVVGYLRFSDDSKNIWQSAKIYTRIRDDDILPSDVEWKRCITLYNIGKLRSKLKALDNSAVIVTGVTLNIPRGEDEVNLNSCNTIGISARSVNRYRAKG